MTQGLRGPANRRPPGPLLAWLLSGVIVACSLTGCDSGDPDSSPGTVTPTGQQITAGGTTAEPTATSGRADGSTLGAGLPCHASTGQIGWEQPNVMAGVALDGCRLVYLLTGDQHPELAVITGDGATQRLGSVPEVESVLGDVRLLASSSAIWIAGTAEERSTVVRIDRSTGARTVLPLVGDRAPALARAGDDVVAATVAGRRSIVYRLSDAGKVRELARVNRPLTHLAVHGRRIVAIGDSNGLGWAAVGRLSGGPMKLSRLGSSLQARGLAVAGGRVTAAFEHLDAALVPDGCVVYTGTSADPGGWKAGSGQPDDYVDSLVATADGMVLAPTTRGDRSEVLRVDAAGKLHPWKSFPDEESIVQVLPSGTTTWLIGQKSLSREDATD